MGCRKCPYYDCGLSDQYCDKIGGKTLLFGYCENAYSDIRKQINHSKQKRRNKRERDQKYKNHLKYLAKNVSGYPLPVMYADKIWIKGQGYIKNQKPYYKRCYRGRGKHSASHYHKKMSNKKIRRYEGELTRKGNIGYKLYDFWWKIS